jgi:hypothetical protein
MRSKNVASLIQNAVYDVHFPRMNEECEEVFS